MKNLNILSKIILLFCFLGSCFLSANAQKLSESAKVSVITIDPGKELNDVFGHSLLWIYDPANGIDRAYNWGVYDFSTPNFYWKFIQGTLPYKMEYRPIGDYIAYYQYMKRGMSEQVLDMALAQKQRILDELDKTYNDPAKRIYQYKFFTDNCATRVREAIVVACTDSVHFANLQTMSDTTFRQWMNKSLYAGDMRWPAVAMNIALGSEADERTTQFEANYIPANLHRSLGAAKRMTHRVLRYLVDTEAPLFPLVKEEVKPMPFFLQPAFFFLMVLLFTCWKTYDHWKRRQKGYKLDKILFSIAGFIGWILVFLWFGTNHGVTENNKNILWALPFHLPLIFRLREKNGEDWYVYYFVVTGVASALALVFVAPYMIELVLIVLTLLVRSMYHVGFEREHRLTMNKFRKVIKGRKMQVINYDNEE
ncbi:lipoprotein N-acyltransferase Lnb domain-containing protein [Flectobacillus roseus]|uniref:DUF4105 domain-containing protein n=1 Tax=Flectobacillus roseus TaxID=502259 RepID=A0ABT6Y7W0_9BACT|nr:DUF4105 domain-containing protein [Flectobacillus roseus]MDI9859667.1 DUF4105 domain-containing protein [Flectobacillus roseus]MDI9868857.1 DUF4105 domain-containing protein [Flectobacillus roseus]